MTFGEIFWPVLAALFCVFVFKEVFHFGVGFYLHKSQERARREMEEKIARGEIEDPMSFMFGGGLGGYPEGGLPPLPTTSGERTGKDYHGQYL